MEKDHTDYVATGLRQAIAQIRFGLGQLSAWNGYHEFEEMTRALARETVSRNILPATGPVSAGGDHGRDFETFKTYVAGQVFPIGVGLGIAEGDNIAFACSLQAEDIGSKILSDVAKIVSRGTSVQHVVYYCETNVPVGRRHALQAKVRKAHDIHLEIFDGTAISELLSQRHLHWIAQQFLHLPAIALPSRLERPEWYDDDLRRWREADYPPSTFGDLVDLSGCLRYATFHEEAETDIPFWLDKMRGFLHNGLPSNIQQKARYEIAVAQLRGLGDLRPADDLVATYMGVAFESDDPSELYDAAVLLMYCIGARGRGLTGHNEERLLKWNHELQVRTSELLATTDQPGQRCALLKTLGWLRSQPDLVAARDAGIVYELPPEVPRLSIDEIEDLERSGLTEPVHVPLVDLSGAFDAWVEMVDLLGEAPLFPVEQLGEMLRFSAHLLVEDDRYDAVVTAIDTRIAEVVGAATAASGARDRAMIFYRNGRLLDALREIHRARIGWFSGETTDGMVLASLMTSQIYRELELPVAAKYYAMTAARLVSESNKELFARACFKAAGADYHQGAWFSTLILTELALKAHLLLAEDPHNWRRHEHLQYAFFELTMIRAIATAAGGEYSIFVSMMLERTGTNELLDNVVESLGETPWWESLSSEELAQSVSDQLGQLAFSDGGERRLMSWKALGVEWSIEFQNDYESTIVGERLAAFAQIIMAEVAAHDPVLLPTEVVFEVAVCEETRELTLESFADDNGTRWHVRLPRIAEASKETFRKVEDETLKAVLSAIRDVSVLPEAEFLALFEKLFSEGLSAKLIFGTIYDFAFQNLIKRSSFEEVPRVTAPPLSPPVLQRPLQSKEMVPIRSGPHYDHDESISSVRERYRFATEALIATLPALRSHAPFREVAERLRATEWKDWHILLAIFNVAQNHRFRPFCLPRTEAEAKENHKVFMRPEELGKPAPLELFTEDALRAALRVTWLSTLKGLGLELYQNPPDIEAVEKLLTERYSYWDDDIPHVDPFSTIPN